MLSRWSGLSLKAPLSVTWEVTGRCNLRCEHCLSAAFAEKGHELSSAEARKLIDELARLEVFYLNMGGGEPFLREDMMEILLYTMEKNIPIQISTNGTLIDREKADALEKIKDLRIQVSLDGTSEAINDRIRGTGSYQKALAAMGLLAARSIDLSLNFVVMRDNFSQLDEAYAFAQQHGATFRVSRSRPSGMARAKYENMHLLPPENRQLYHWLQGHPDVSTGDSFFFLSALGKSLPGINTCGAARMTCSIAPNGDLFPCAFLMDGEKAGNIRENSLESLWKEAPLFERYRKREVEECLSCSRYGSCHGGCPAVSTYYTGKYDSRDPECLLGG